MAFRLPLPPRLDSAGAGVWAIERRMRNAYFAALDALRTGQVVAERREKLVRLRAQVRSSDARTALSHLERVLDAVSSRESRAPLFPSPERLTELTATVPVDQFGPSDLLARRFAWPLEWLRTRGYLAAGEGHVRWRTGAAL